MTKRKKQIIIRPDKKVFEFEGRTFKHKLDKLKKIDGVEHLDYAVFEEVDMDREKETIDFIKTKLAPQLSQERVIEEVLKELPTKQLKKIEKLLKKENVQIKPQNGCFGIKIDGGKRNNTYVSIFD